MSTTPSLRLAQRLGLVAASAAVVAGGIFAPSAFAASETDVDYGTEATSEVASADLAAADACAKVGRSVPISQTTAITPNVRVHKCFGARTKALIDDARKVGIDLGKANSSYRTYDQQVALRRQNCGTTHYDIYDKPSSQCSPATAKPGQSNHESGLAIDFAVKNNPKALAWLKANASKYHFYNKVAGEPWHWSYSGH